MNERDLKLAALHLKRFELFLGERKWEQARKEWQYTPDGMAAMPSVLAQMDVLADHLPAMIQAGQFEAAARAVASIRAELPGYREDELLRFEFQIAEPLEHLKKVDLLLNRGKFAEALHELEWLQSNQTMWVVENFEDRIIRIRESLAQQMDALNHAGTVSIETLVPPDKPPAGEHRKRKSKLPIVLFLLALIPAVIGTSIAIVNYSGRPLGIAQPPPLPPPPPAPHPGPLKPLDPVVAEIPMAVSDDLSRSDQWRLVERKGSERSVLPVSMLLQNDRNVDNREKPLRVEVRAVRNGLCDPVVDGSNVIVKMSGKRLKSGMDTARFDYRLLTRQDIDPGEESWASVRLKVLHKPILVSGLKVPAGPDGNCRIPRAQLFPGENHVELVHPWEYRMKGTPDWSSAGSLHDAFLVPDVTTRQGAPQQIELRGRVRTNGEEFPVETSVMAYGTMFACRKENCPAGDEVVITEGDMRGAFFPYTVAIEEPHKWSVVRPLKGTEIELKGVDGGGGIVVIPRDRLNGEVKVSGPATYYLPAAGEAGERTRVEARIEVELTFTGAPEVAAIPSSRPSKPPPDPPVGLPSPFPTTDAPTVEIVSELRMFIANNASESWFQLPADNLVQGGWELSRKRLTIRSDPHDALVNVLQTKDKISFFCSGPAVVAIEQKADHEAPDAKTVRVYAIVLTDRGAVSEENIRRLASLSSYREAEEFKSAVLEEYATIVSSIPPDLHAALAKTWLENHSAMLDKAYESGVVRGSASKRAVAERLKKIAAVMSQGEG